MIDVDQGHWPLVLIAYRGSLTMPELKQSLVELDRVLERRQPFVTIGDISTLATPGPDLLRRQASWYRERDAQLRDFCLASATVAKNPLLRGIVKALSWIHPMPQPQAVVPTFDQGLDFVEEKLKERKLALPPSAARLRTTYQRPPNA